MFDKRNQQSQTGCRRRVLTRYVHRPAHYCLPGPLVAPPSAPADREYGRLGIHASLMESGLREDASNGFGCKCDITGLCRFLMFVLEGKLWDLNTILSFCFCAEYSSPREPPDSLLLPSVPSWLVPSLAVWSVV